MWSLWTVWTRPARLLILRGKIFLHCTTSITTKNAPSDSSINWNFENNGLGEGLARQWWVLVGEERWQGLSTAPQAGTLCIEKTRRGPNCKIYLYELQKYLYKLQNVFVQIAIWQQKIHRVHCSGRISACQRWFTICLMKNWILLQHSTEP